jgi:virulence-associated protein VapD
MKKCGLLLMPVTFALVTIACNTKYTEADVQQTQTDIKTQLEQKGFVVEQVSMVKDSDRHMTGFAKVHKADGLFSKLELTKNCTATKDMDSGKSIWECK